MKLLKEKLMYVRAKDTKTGKIWNWSADNLRWTELPKDLLENIKLTMKDCIIQEVKYESDLDEIKNKEK
jgi:hypothetical protein